MESSEAQAPYMLDPVSITKELKLTPYKRLKFVTIRDNRTDKKIDKIGKCYDYLKRFSERMWIVMSPMNGIHFHALIVLKPNRQISYKKNVHIRVDDVGDKRQPFDPEFEEDRRQDAEELYLEAYDRTGDVKHAEEVYAQKLAPPSKEYQRILRQLSKEKKSRHISKIVSYLNKNLGENIGNTYQYQHYIIK